jgi:hypothetical protein
MKLPGPGQWYKITRDLVYEDDNIILTVPAGMISDGNSGLIRDAERDIAGWVHDLTYRRDAGKYIRFKRKSEITRRWADKLYRKVAILEGTPRITAFLDYVALRVLGGFSWRKKYVT